MEFSQMAILLVSAAFAGLLVKKFKQPVLVGYVAAGFIVTFLGILTDVPLMGVLGKVGVTLLLFLVGLEMNIKEISSVGKLSFFITLGQTLLTFVLGFSLGLLMRLGILTSVYLSCAVTFSSTIIIINLLSQKNALGSFYGKLSITVLLIQDFLAIAILLFLSGLNRDGFNFHDYLLIVFKAIALITITWYLSKKILPKFFENYVAESQELLFIVSLAWALGFASLVAGPLGFTLEIGGFLAGLALSNIPEHLEIASKTRPLRDFFLILFFMSLGVSLVGINLSSTFKLVIVFSLFVLLIKPLIMMAVMGLLKFKRRTAFLTSISTAQVSEFSLIIVSMGAYLGHITNEIASVTIMIAALTMILSTYLILGSEKIYGKLKDRLKIFERKDVFEIQYSENLPLENHIVLVGCYRTGRSIVSILKKKGYPFLVVDFNPKVYKTLSEEGYPVIYGDISDPEILVKASLDKARMIISTIDNMRDNQILLEYVKRFNLHPITVFTAITRSDALKMYESGASYVIVPDIVAGEHIRHMIRAYGISEKFKILGKNHLKKLMFS